MPIPSREKIRPIARILKYVPVVMSFFFALSFWRKGSIGVAVIFGLMGIGLLLFIAMLNSFE